MSGREGPWPGWCLTWVLSRRQEQFQRNPDSYNGAVRDSYTWSQDYTDLELKVPVPKHVVKGRQVTSRSPDPFSHPGAPAPALGRASPCASPSPDLRARGCT